MRKLASLLGIVAFLSAWLILWASPAAAHTTYGITDRYDEVDDHGNEAITVAVAPTIGGVPLTSVAAPAWYDFRPIATDAKHRTLRFEIRNKPDWASFDRYSGRLQGWVGIARAGSTYSEIVISVSNGHATSSLQPFSIAVASHPQLVISGTPANLVKVGQPYSFAPVARNSSGAALTFRIVNKPSWVVFSSTTGQMSGIPGLADVGTTADISIGVSDGQTATALHAFSITVTQTSTGSAMLSWTRPTQNIDGSALIDLTGYRILYGTAPTQLSRSLEIGNAGMTSALIENLSPGTYYFTVEALAASGAVSAPSGVVSKTI